jgi:ABC-2 type transport system permease protein
MRANVFRQEWRSLLAEQSIQVIAALMAVLIGWPIYNGATWVRFQEKTLAAAANDQQERLHQLRQNLSDIEAGRVEPKGFLDPRSPASIGNATGVPFVVMPPAPLSAFSIGQSDVYPYYFKLGLRSKQTVLNSDEIENPLNLLSGRFDLAFVIVYLFPLLILSLTYNLISEEKENATLALALSQPIRLSTLIAQKTLFRGLFLIALCGLVHCNGGSVERGESVAARNSLPALRVDRRCSGLRRILVCISSGRERVGKEFSDERSGAGGSVAPVCSADSIIDKRHC